MKNKKSNLYIFMSLLMVMLSNQRMDSLVVDASEQYDPKIYYTFSENEDFDDDTVIVVMDRLLSQKNKIHSPDFFGDNIVQQIRDLTYGEVNILGNNFEQILELKLFKKDKKNVVNVVKQLEKIPGIKYVAPNSIIKLTQASNDTYAVSNELWAIENINLPATWEHTTGLANIRVGVIDTGVSFHPDIIDNLVTGYDFFYENTITHDDKNSHGTQVAGIIGAVGNNNLGITGVNWDVSIVPLQITDPFGEVFSSLYIDAINYATESTATINPINILNLSLGYYTQQPLLESAIRQYPGLLVCSAGNEGYNTDDNQYYHYPGFYGSSIYSSPLNNMIVVGAIDENNERSIWNDSQSSNYGSSTVDIYAPGSNIISTYPENLYIQNGDGHISVGYYNNGGTSFSAPYVTGVAALLSSLKPDLTPLQLKYAILNSADTISITLPDDSHQNVKKLNAFSAMKYILGTQTHGLSLQYGNESYSSTINGSSQYYLEKNAFVRLAVNADYEYDFSLSSANPINITLYDDNLDEISITPTYTNSNCNISFSKYLATGTYYLKTNYVNTTTSGTVNFTIYGPPHTHSYTSWIYHNNISHIEVCDCGTIGTAIQPHAISPSDRYKDRANCIGCGAIINLTGGGGITIVPGPSNNNTQVTINGSYILPSGIIILVDEDIEDYLNGTLVFYDKDEVPLIN